MDATKETLELLFKSLGITNTLIYVLISILVLNIFAIVIKFFLDRKLKDHDKAIHRKNQINNKAIKVQESIYSRLERLSLYTADEDEELLSELQKLQRYVSNKRLYLNKQLQEIINESLDYFRTVLTDYRQKDLDIEKQLWERYEQEFNK